MATIAKESLKAQFESLHAERLRTWPTAQLDANIAQRRKLVTRFDPAAVAQSGERLEPFDLIALDGRPLPLSEFTENGPAVFVFFRFAGCPACNIALPYYDRQLQPELARRGIPLVAVSPQIPERLRDITERHDLSLTVASDPDNALGRRLGIVFEPDDRPADPPAGWIGDVTGTGTWELPQPAVLVLDKGLVVRSLDVSPDWLDRTEVDSVLDIVLGRNG